MVKRIKGVKDQMSLKETEKIQKKMLVIREYTNGSIETLGELKNVNHVAMKTRESTGQIGIIDIQGKEKIGNNCVQSVIRNMIEKGGLENNHVLD